MNIALIGYRGTGKSSIARQLATRLQCSWADADAVLEEQAGKSIREMFDSDGEPAFRELEEQILATLMEQSDTVLALGGGVILRERNRQVLRAAKVIWLTALPETIVQRLSSDPLTRDRRPDLTPAGGRAEVERLLVEREPLYRQCANHIVATDDKSPEQIVDEIVCLLEET